MVDISTISNHLIGISFLKETDTTCVKAIWDKRFPDSEASFTRAELNESASDILKKVIAQIVGSSIGSLAGKSCVVAIFLDIQDPITSAQLDTIGQLSIMIQTALFCTVSTEVQFAYIGTNPVPKESFQGMKDCVTALSHACATNAVLLRRVCLVAQTMSAQKLSCENWKAVSVFLDLMRRNQQNDIIPTAGFNSNDDVVFLRYGEYDASRRKTLEKTLEKVRKSLGNDGESELLNLIEIDFSKLAQKAAEAVPVCAEQQTIHPDMNVDGFLQKRAAKKGNNKKFKTAQDAMKLAITNTKDAMDTAIAAFYKRALLPSAKEYLLELTERASVGLGLFSDRAKMKEILAPEKGVIFPPHTPEFNYNEKGYLAEIKQYLDQAQSYIIHKSAFTTREELLKAYLGIKEEYFAKQYSERRKLLQDTENELEGIPEEDAFLRDAESSGVNLSASFYPVKPGGLTKRILLEYDYKVAENHDNKTSTDIITMYFSYSQLIAPDPIGTRALHILSFNCTDDRLDDLIKGI